jgi:hypothetical protein
MAAMNLANAQESSPAVDKPLDSPLEMPPGFEAPDGFKPLRVNRQPRPALIDDTTSRDGDSTKTHRVLGVSRRGELVEQPEKSNVRDSGNERVRAALDSPTRMEFTEMPLVDAVAFLKDYHNLEIQLDQPALEAAGVGNDTPVNRNLNSLRLGSALNLLLEPLGLTYLVRDGVLLITTEAVASKHLELRVYDVGKHIGPEVKAEEVATMLSLLNQSQASGGGMGGMMVTSSHVRLVPFRNLLIVRASQHEHEEIVGLFAELKKQLAVGE